MQTLLENKFLLQISLTQKYKKNLEKYNHNCGNLSVTHQQSHCKET